MLAFVALDLVAVENTTGLNHQVKPNGKYCNLIVEYTPLMYIKTLLSYNSTESGGPCKDVIKIYPKALMFGALTSDSKSSK